MSQFKYTLEHLEFIRVGYQSMSISDLTKAFNDRFSLEKTEKAIKSTLKNHKITCGRKPKDRLVNRTRLFTEEQKTFVRREYKNHSIADLTKLFNEHFGTDMTCMQIQCCTRNHGIKSGRTGQFKKGNKPWNTGLKGAMKPNSGNFQKGHVPANRKPIGSERISRDGFIEIKVAEKNPYTGFPTRYKHKHVHVWEQRNGPVPDGMVVAFKDSDPTNCNINNLMLLSRAELLKLNQHGYKKMPVELKPSILAVSKLQVKAMAKEREMNSKHADALEAARG